jgi:hypothetical protein
MLRRKKPENSGPRPTTPEEEGLELHPDSWERFKRTFHKVVKSGPVHRKAEIGKAAANRRRQKTRGDAS